MCSDIPIPQPKYIRAKILFDKNAFMFIKHNQPFDVYSRCTNKLLFCEPCRNFVHYDDDVIKKKIRGGNDFFIRVTNYVNTI